MAKLERPKIELLVDSAGDRDNNDSQILIREQTLLLRSNERKRYYCRMSCAESRPGSSGRRVKMAACCLKSKGIVVILCWNTLLTLLTIPWLLPDTYSLIIATLRHTPLQEASPIAVPSFYVFEAILYLFYPLAGYLADIKYGRYKTITNSLWLTFWSGVFLVIGAIILACYLSLHLHVKMSALTVSLLAIGFGLPSVIGAVLLLTCYVSFKANIIQFGIDQLRDLPTEHSVLFIHWFVFSTLVGITLVRFLKIPFILHPASFTLLKLDFTMKIVAGGFFGIHVVALVILLVTLYLSKRQCQSGSWFTTESAMLGSRRTINPYKLVYKVIKFAAQHKSPIRRSAFTYCEDELPSRMDLAKEKYGGPFTTEQVEDVKTFLRILQVLLTLGPFFGTHLFGGDTQHSSKEKSSAPTPPLLVSIFSFGGLTDFLIVVLILLYICLLRPFICRHIPGISMLKRMGLGMGLLLLISIFHFLVDTIGRNIYNVRFPTYLNVCYLLIFHTLSATGYTLFYIAAYEFICAQSPHAMKGLLIGTFFTVKGVSQLIGTTVVVLLSRYWWKLETPASFSYGLVHSLINIIIAIVGLVAYSWVARRYRHRQRDEPDNVYRYAEEYYSTHR